MSAKLDLAGQRFGRLRVEALAGTCSGKTLWAAGAI